MILFTDTDRTAAKQVRSSYRSPIMAMSRSITVEDAGEATIGKKRRNICMALAAGDYVCAIDDDDLISGTYFTDILRALERIPIASGLCSSEPSMVGRKWDAEHSLKHQRYYNFVWRTQKSGGVVRDVAVRPPNHLNPIRREIALKFPFWEERMRGEDTDFAHRIWSSLKTEVSHRQDALLLRVVVNAVG